MNYESAPRSTTVNRHKTERETSNAPQGPHRFPAPDANPFPSASPRNAVDLARRRVRQRGGVDRLGLLRDAARGWGGRRGGGKIPEEEEGVVRCEGCGFVSTVWEGGRDQGRKNVQTVANHPGPLVSPPPPAIIVSPPHAIPFTGALCPCTTNAGVPGERVSRI